jgi:pimeloyl-ACP methyl ester carboxylesterase
MSWTRVAPILASMGYQVIAPDLRGHGNSAASRTSVTLEELVEDIAASCPTSPDLLIGHSFGGTLAALGFSMGLLEPSILVLEDPVLVMSSAAEAREHVGPGFGEAPLDFSSLRQSESRWTDEDVAIRVVASYQTTGDQIRKAWDENAPWDLRELVEGIPSARVGVVLPERSTYLREADVARLRDRLGPSRVAEVVGAGHSIHRDDLAAFIGIISEWTGAHTPAP